jgi:transmembrane sensor
MTSSTPEKIVQNLINDPVFTAWVLGDRQEMDQYWEKWARESPVHKTALEQARYTLLTFHHDHNEITDEHIAFKIQQALETAKKREHLAKRPVFSQKWNPFKSVWLGAACVTALLVIGGVNLYPKLHSKSSFVTQQEELVKESNIVEVLTSDNKAKYVQLPDGSSVILQPKSRIRFAKEFETDKRIVTLSGEAFFEVTKDAERPFFVYTNELVTKVLGTSFSIKATESEDNILIAVKTGKVSVFRNNDENAEDYKKGKKLSALLLSPNEQAYFERAKSYLKRSSKVGAALLKIPIEKQNFIYDETPVSEVFASLEKAYGINIVYNEKSMSQCSVTATLGDEPLDNKLKWICTILEAEYKINDTEVIITGNNCR